MIAGDDDAIRRRALYGVTLGSGLPHADGIGERQGMRRAALLGFRGDHPDVIAESRSDPFEQQDPRRVNAVVICD